MTKSPRATPPRDSRRSASPRGNERPARSEDGIIDEAGKESFPASDPPAWTLGVETPPSRAESPGQGIAATLAKRAGKQLRREP